MINRILELESQVRLLQGEGRGWDRRRHDTGHLICKKQPESGCNGEEIKWRTNYSFTTRWTERWSNLSQMRTAGWQCTPAAPRFIILPISAICEAISRKMCWRRRFATWVMMWSGWWILPMWGIFLPMRTLGKIKCSRARSASIRPWWRSRNSTQTPFSGTVKSWTSRSPT